MPKDLLKGIWIVNTRPIHQAASLTQNIKKEGGCLLHFPLIEITPFNDTKTRKRLQGLIDYDIVIFVSSNAVNQTLELIGTNILAKKTLATTGKKTAQALLKNSLLVDFCPETFFNSEALLAVNGFTQACKNKKVAIVRGSSGRDYLKNKLAALGAKVDYIDVYSKHCPQKNLNELRTAFNNKELDIVLLTSASSTANFFALSNNERWIDEITLLIGSSRMQHEIPSEFKGKILIADDPSDETLLNKLTTESNKR